MPKDAGVNNSILQLNPSSDFQAALAKHPYSSILIPIVLAAGFGQISKKLSRLK